MKIDINCDLGEGGKEDAQIMALISSCNIACGGHFGDESTIAETVGLAVKNKVNIGAHPSYPDLENFGRKPVDIPLKNLKKSIQEQIERVHREAERHNAKLHHVKPHGMLYHDLTTDGEKAEIFVEVIREINPNLILFAPPKSILLEKAKGKLKTWVEGFADRNYGENFNLVPRQKKHALLSEKEAVFDRVFSMAKDEKIPLRNNRFLSAKLDTFCVHSDTPNCVEILKFLNQKLPEKNIQISGR
jgi:UPF0271 protein